MNALKRGDIARFKDIEATDGDWWFVRLDRGAGAALHFAVAAGQLEAVEFLIREREAPVNQQSRSNGHTPLHVCARLVHERKKPYLEIYDLLLRHGADPTILTDECEDDLIRGGVAEPRSVYDLCVKRGRGWDEGRVREVLLEMAEKHANVPKSPAWRYEGPLMGPRAIEVLEAWKELPKLYPPANWLPPPDAGYKDSRGMRDVSKQAWQPAGTKGDGSKVVRPMTEDELRRQEQEMDAYAPK